MSEIVNASESRSAVDMYSSIQGADLETRKTIFNAVNSAEPIADHLGTVRKSGRSLSAGEKFIYDNRCLG